MLEIESIHKYPTESVNNIVLILRSEGSAFNKFSIRDLSGGIHSTNEFRNRIKQLFSTHGFFLSFSSDLVS